MICGRRNLKGDRKPSREIKKMDVEYLYIEKGGGNGTVVDLFWGFFLQKERR